jgi:hypothetical protein
MPKALEERLRRQAAKAIPMPKGASTEVRKRIAARRDAYVYDTLRKIKERQG